jgi:hypothetical protein
MSTIQKVIKTATTALLIISLCACVSTSVRPPSNADIYYDYNSWSYDQDYRSGINGHYYPRSRAARARTLRRRYH